jgi:uncharacterized coiled-coil DUF342 family protein
MEYKIYMLIGIVFFTLGCSCAEQQKIDTVVRLGNETIEKCLMLQDLDNRIKQHSQEVFVKLGMDEQEKERFQQKLAFLQENLDLAQVNDIQAILEKELFRTINMAVQSHATEAEEVAVLKDEILKYLAEGNELKRLAANYNLQLTALGKKAPEEYETFREKLQRINSYLGDYCETVGLVVVAGGLTGGIAVSAIYGSLLIYAKLFGK